MSDFSFGVEAVYAAQRYSRELVKSVWSIRFYEYLLDVLEHGTWQEYTTEAYGRPCRFADVREFLTHQDGLGWPTLKETVQMIKVVSKCTASLPPEKNVASTKPLREWAEEALKALKANAINVDAPEADAWLSTKVEREDFAQAGDNRHTLKNPSRDIVTARSAGDGGNSAAYLAARLKKAGRDDLLQQIGPDKPFRSIRAAAIEAGIIKPVPTVRLTADIPAVATRICQHLTPEQVHSLCEALLSISTPTDEQ